jgi:diaminohydroxyphosphoribosylaminopyrimidine deaminase/5-amino-6-(5-phosphoribosylamino)uracil reductase
LRAAGIDVITSVRAADARLSMAGFLTRQALGRPHVTLKLALSLDGAAAMANGSSKWITGPEARAHAHLERARHEAILVGRGTREADTPSLDVRLAGLEGRSPRKFVLSGETGAVNSPSDIAALPNVDHLLVEGGARTAAAFLAEDLVDRLLLYRAPILIGGGRTLPDIGLGDLSAAHGRWRLHDARQLGSDRLEVYERVRETA